VTTTLTDRVCEHLEAYRAIGYLETDKEANVRLYRRGGFRLIDQQPVLGVTNYFMLREPVSN